MRKIDKIIVHCADTPEAMDIGLEEINQWHEEMGFSPSPTTGLHCGYHAIIRRDGVVELARPEQEPGIHCKGHNASSLAVCLVGGKTPDSFTKEQMSVLQTLVLGWCARYGLEPKHVFGHREFNAKKVCPNITNLEAFRDMLEIRYYSQTGGK